MNNYYIFKDARYNKVLIAFLIVILIILSSVFGIYLGYIITKSKENFNFFDFILFLIKFILIYYISILVHELGHVGMYIVYKYSIKLVLVGPIVIIVENNRIIYFRVNIKYEKITYMKCFSEQMQRYQGQFMVCLKLLVEEMVLY